jgi:type I restriction-modification system DNA methylase subunit
MRSLDAAHRNQRLFSDYYLNYLLPLQWESLRSEAEAVMKQLQTIYAQFTPNPNNEAQTEDDWIKPVLRTLGHTFEVQAPLKVPESVQKPDYVFYRDEAARIANKGKVLTDEMLSKMAYAVGDAKQWDRSLDRATKGSDAFTNKNPSYQIFFYMLHSQLPWGFLTNGRLWRLYHEQTAHKLEIYYEVDLPALLASDDANDFLYFYTFFRRAAFESGSLSLEQILTASTDYARGVSDSLRQQVYDALRYVAQGFLDYPGNHLEPTPETCRAIYDNSLTLLYRLLFILYAEARDLLPLRNNKAYRRNYSLYTMKSEIAVDGAEALLPNTGIIWIRIKELCTIIDRGSPPLNVTTFNGGLFDPQRHPFLERYVVGDRSLCRAIDKLARINSQFIDYRDLAERHLGTIYEGLLEYTLKVATEPMVELKGSSKIVPAQGVSKKEIAAEFRPGEVYLVTDRGERKITGSYYTPDYIVKYMVEQTLRPLLDAAVRQAQSDAGRIQAVLSLNVLDPSMGSGHFPVEVMEYIARYLVELGVQPEETDEADLVYWKRRVAQHCIYGVDVNPLAVDLAKLSLWLATVAKDRPLNFLDHHLRTGNALIGSWLAEVAAGQHPKARQQNQKKQQKQEMVGRSEDVSQLSLAALDDEFQQNTSVALASMAQIEHNPGMTISDVKQQETAYEALRLHFSEKYRLLANLCAALHYDLNIGDDDWRPLTAYALGKLDSYSPTMLEPYDAFLDAVEVLAGRKRFFHWELEFPDIFFAPDGQPLGERAGFDVVIGNPPYVRQEQLGPDKPYFQEHYEVYHGVADLFVYFFAQGLKLLRPGGKLAYISSNTWIRANYATPLRHYLRTQTTVETIVELGNTRVFADAPDLSPSIQIVSKTLPEGEYQAQVAIFSRGEQVKVFKEQLADRQFALSIHDQLDTGWQLTSDDSRKLFSKLMATGNPLGDVIERRMYRGVLTGLNAAFIIDQATRDRLIKEDTKCSSIIKPMLKGEDLRPWYQENEGRWLIFTRRGIDMNNYPSILAHLQQFREQLEPRPEGWNSRTPWLGRKPGPYKWYEIQDSIEYYEEFEKHKLFWADMARFPRFSWDTQGHYSNDKGFFLIGDLTLLGILQSRICWFCISRLCAPLAERLGLIIYQQKIQYMIHLPIPSLSGEQQERIGELAQQLTDVARKRYEVRRRTAHRILHDLGPQGTKLNQKLEQWWDLSFKEFREELVKIFKRDISLKDRDDWEELLRERGSDIRRLTDEIIRLETLLNEAVYDAFGLDAMERRLIEQETKYAYGEW